ncbi:unnamed protein product [Larinioides sclopetarius]|uniref:Non-structural maintenance of chromosomes element 1 homolog n=1 Tax=Larinioides sclopetarius TaxID=280406 RepID=A0AAV1ZVM6_9ARAC
MKELDDKHKFFLQAFMWKKICGNEEVWNLFRKCHRLVNDGYYFFSTRAIAELHYFFKENYSENISTCYLCKNIVFQGPVCQNCDIKLHNYCMKRSGIKMCPSCRSDFNAH